MARPTDQALVSDQAAARLDPSGFDPSRVKQNVAEIARQFIESEAGCLYEIAMDYGLAIKSGKMGNRTIKPEQARLFAAEFRVRADALYIIAPQLRDYLIKTDKGGGNDGNAV